jgi:NAD(P)-dependent dehydrogenase (short-subunit alcohol dehydrogenase family)
VLGYGLIMKTFLITGSSTGIGEACALHLDRLGHQVYAGVRRESDGDRLRAKASDRMTPVIVDVTDEASIDAAAKRVESEVGRLDGLVNNAGVGRGGPIEFLDLDEWKDQFEVNVFGQVAVTKKMLPLVRKSPAGRIVFISSIGGKVSTQSLGPYNSSKHAIEAIGDALRQELHPWGIGVSLVEPGAIRTEIWAKASETVEKLEREYPAEARELYARHIEGVKKGLEFQTKNAAPAEKVAKAVEHALLASRPRTRYLVGRDARLMAVMRSLLPDRALDAMVRRVSGP